MATGEYFYRETNHGLEPLGQTPSWSVGYIYTPPASITSTWKVCGRCSVWYDSAQPHTCSPPTLTVTGRKRTPHKCPCCDGWGTRGAATCAACDGKGVLWE